MDADRYLASVLPFDQDSKSTYCIPASATVGSVKVFIESLRDLNAEMQTHELEHSTSDSTQSICPLNGLNDIVKARINVSVPLQTLPGVMTLESPITRQKYDRSDFPLITRISPLVYAVYRRDPKKVKLLLDMGANPALPSLDPREPFSALGIAIATSHYRTAELFFTEGHKLNADSTSEHSKLLQRYIKANTTALELLVIKDHLPADIAKSDGYDIVPPEISLPGEELPVVIQLGLHAIPTGFNSGSYVTGDLTIRGFLTLSHVQGELNKVDRHGNTALQLFVLADDILSVCRLFEFEENSADFRLDINKPNNAGYTPLMLAVVKSPLIATVLLSRRSIDITITDKSGHTALSYLQHRRALHRKSISQQRWKGDICAQLREYSIRTVTSGCKF